MKQSVSKLFWALIFLLATVPAQSQEKNAVSAKVSAELVSSYIWRGSPSFSTINGQPVLAPNIQPTLGVLFGGLEIGAWGSTDFTGSYQEMDLYASYTIKGLTATVSDYFWSSDWATKPYFLYKNETTGHIVEGMLSYQPEKVPIRLTVATMLYGADKSADDQSKNNYSTYFELGYTFNIQDYDFNAVVGMTPADGFYGDGYGNITGFGIVNIGLTGSKKIKISEKLETTIRSSLVFNPQQEKAYLVFGISL
jgi:hypothetical protein